MLESEGWARSQEAAVLILSWLLNSYFAGHIVLIALGFSFVGIFIAKVSSSWLYFFLLISVNSTIKLILRLKFFNFLKCGVTLFIIRLVK